MKGGAVFSCYTNIDIFFAGRNKKAPNGALGVLNKAFGGLNGAA
jgi:hypothetical protein